MKKHLQGLLIAVPAILLLIAAFEARSDVSNPPLIMQNGGTPIGAAAVLNCSTNTSCSNSGGVVTLTATGGSSGLPIQANGTPVATATTLNFDNGTGTTVTCTNSAGTVTCTYNSSGGGTSLHYQYYTAGYSASQTFGCPDASNNNTLTVPAGGAGATVATVLLCVMSNSGQDLIIETQLPSTWNSGTLSAIVDALWASAGTGSGSFQAYSSCVAVGTNNGLAPISPTWTSAGSNVSHTSPASQWTQGQWALTVPVTSCSAGNFIMIDIRRPSTDSFTGNLDIYGVNLGINY